jgi:hypothetical protein
MLPCICQAATAQANRPSSDWHVCVTADVIGCIVMGLFDALLGNASEVDVNALEDIITSLLIDGENVTHAYQLLRDMIIFTDKRLILLDKQGFSGKKQEILSIPYGSISKFSKENAGRFDRDAEIKLWIRGDSVPLELSFRAGTDLDGMYRVLSNYIL